MITKSIKFLEINPNSYRYCEKVTKEALMLKIVKYVTETKDNVTAKCNCSVIVHVRYVCSSACTKYTCVMIHVQYMRIYLLVYDCPYTIYSELNLFFNVRNNFFQINVLLT